MSKERRRLKIVKLKVGEEQSVTKVTGHEKFVKMEEENEKIEKSGSKERYIKGIVYKEKKRGYCREKREVE